MARYVINFVPPNGNEEPPPPVECLSWCILQGGILRIDMEDPAGRRVTQIVTPEAWRNAIIEKLED